MPIRKQLNYGTNQGRLIIWPTPSKTRGGIEVHANLTKAKRQADHDAVLLDQHRYVVPIENEGYAVMGYADLWDYLEDDMKNEIVYQVDAPRTSKGKKWPGEA